ncbi:MAG: DUF922 domain-containing protein [Chloroflexi bacterium]|nr:DUF922 domain-containing protein [Chloroflexota bacterium]
MAKCGKGKVARRVLCGEPTKPPHTDEVNPGTCSRVKVFCLAPGEPEPDWACWQHRYQLMWNPRQFQDCADAAATLQKEAEKDIPAATTQYQIKDVLFYSNGRSAGNYTCDVTVYWQVDWGNMVMTLPEYSWPNMSSADNAAVQSALNALRAHEEGHVNITEEYVTELSGGSIKISGSGATPTAARESCDVQLAIHEAQIAAELRKRQNEYDDRTHHGAKQSEIGGVDVKLVCPSE